MSKLTQTLVLVVALLGWSAALPQASDRDQPIHIQADNAIVDETTGTSVYRGTVNIRQGTLKIDADEVEIITANEEVVQIIASMDDDSPGLAHYEQLPEDSEDMVYADARNITYLVQEEKIHLAGQASLRQVQDLFEGELLHYDLKGGIVNLNSSNDPDDRIQMTINPRKKPE